MRTCCPKCRTIYLLSGDELGVAEGKVRCSRCNSAFYALEHLQQEEKPESDNTAPPVLVNGLRLGRDNLEQEAENELSPYDETHLALQSGYTPRRSSPVWWAFTFFLLLAVIGQFAWLERLRLVEHPQALLLMQMLCRQLGCDAPVRRDLGRLNIKQSDLGALGGAVEGLSLDVQVVNGANFAQPFPMLQLELFDLKQHQAGKRIFAPKEYLHPFSPDLLFGPGEKLRIKLELVDPGPEITGFEIDLL